VFDNTSNYRFWQENMGDTAHYYVSFFDISGIHHEIEVSEDVFQAFVGFHRTERNLRRSDERHEEHLVLTDEEVTQRATGHQKTVEEIVFDRFLKESVQNAIAALPEIQRRRFLLHYQYGLTCKQIAGLEGCSSRAIEHSMKAARENFIKNFRF
jgi:DNA-directed RNA polymerase specialized sigma subunit, sigma24 homolog